MTRHHRFDRDVNARRVRAQAHLARVRGRRDPLARGRGGEPGAAFRIRRVGLLVAGVAGALGLLFGDALMLALAGSEQPVERIAVRGAERLTADAVATATGIAAGTPLRAVDASAVAQALETHDWIGSARALRLPGGAVLVDILEREPVATVTLDRQLYAVATDGEPFAALEDGALPGLVRLVPEGEVVPGEPSPRLATAIQLAGRLPELGLAAPSEVRIAADDDPRGYALRLAALEADVVLGSVDLDARLEALARLLTARPDVVTDATSIDLRFADQVVLRSGPAQEGSTHKAAGRGDVRPRNLQPTG